MLFHHCIQFFGLFEKLKFVGSFHQVEKVQKKQLEKILAVTSRLPWASNFKKSITNYSQFVEQVPLSTWSDYQDHFTVPVRSQYLKDQTVQRFEPTSGSTFERKWIPMTPNYISELNQAASAWLGELYAQFPQIKRGFHYWSLSWLPVELRADLNNDDSDLFPWWKKFFLARTFLSHPKLATVASEEAWRFGTLIYLLSKKDLTFISVWSPTFLIGLKEYLDENYESLFLSHSQKSWINFSESLQDVPFPTFDCHYVSAFELKQQAFQNLKLISCWTSGSSQIFIPQLKAYFPHCQIQGKGLWATEAVVTIPFQGQHPLCLRSHFFEFQDLVTQKIHLAHELKRGQQVSVIVSTSAGLLRYQLGDQLEVTGFLGQVPCFLFLGRPGTSDLVGEKLDLSNLRKILHQLSLQNPEVQFYQLGFSRQPQLRYLIFLQNTLRAQSSKKDIADQLEFRLQKFHHYRVARQLGQLQAAEVKLISELSQLKTSAKPGQIQGQWKQGELLEFND